MEEKNDTTLISIIDQIIEKKNKLNINIGSDFVTITFATNGTIGQHQLTYTDFKHLLNSVHNIDYLLNDWIKTAYNKTLKDE
ncbi:MAG: hypothetical protein U9Q27_01925 [Patescibacteria group bacterium]|nr:hypothetical protein [Patescibacteria group bacterium]